MNNGYNDFLLVNNLAEHPDYFQPMSDEDTEAKILGHHDGASDVKVGPCIPLFEPKSEQSPEMLHFGDFSAMDLLRVATSDCEEKKPSTIAEMLTDQIAPSTSFYKEEEALWELSNGVVPKERLKANRYVRCHLCKTVISAAQFTNLSHHARRHAAVKKYKCVWCEVQHNELAKIRAHLATAHCDIVSDPIDNSSTETRKEWNFMLRKCFPECYSNFGNQVSFSFDRYVLNPLKFSAYRNRLACLK
ncbi:unnamed protein product [Heligmosomoides polygyrus]|uniref:C2H2-type domain-containing protein n=1 Tax=Heligmosomoides polygyrus TaxID=6339 RepID=A0A183FAB4_HELPZ|nr:unnamed protein product [Heligmosomoides polygyrus]